MPDQPTASPVHAPGQNLAASGCLAEVLSDHPRWPHGPVLDPEHPAVQEQMRALLCELGHFELERADDGRMSATLTSIVGDLQVSAERSGLATGLVLLTAWHIAGHRGGDMVDGLLELLGGEE